MAVVIYNLANHQRDQSQIDDQWKNTVGEINCKRKLVHSSWSTIRYSGLYSIHYVDFFFTTYFVFHSYIGSVTYCEFSNQTTQIPYLFPTQQFLGSFSLFCIFRNSIPKFFRHACEAIRGNIDFSRESWLTYFKILLFIPLTIIRHGTRFRKRVRWAEMNFISQNTW